MKKPSATNDAPQPHAHRMVGSKESFCNKKPQACNHESD